MNFNPPLFLGKILTLAPSKGRWSGPRMPRSTTGQHSEPAKVQGGEHRWTGETETC
jgi:hypothetical protein